MTRTAVLLLTALCFAAGCSGPQDAALAGEQREMAPTAAKGADKVVKSDAEWREILTPQQFAVLRERGTERAFTGKYHDYHKDGTYVCAACGQELFNSDTKFDSGTGWPSFYAPISKEVIGTEEDDTFFTRRTEVHCSRCGGHLGHVFDDGPAPTGLRYCMNSVSLDFKPR